MKKLLKFAKNSFGIWSLFVPGLNFFKTASLPVKAVYALCLIAKKRKKAKCKNVK
tara:strand:+ start:399 stop:563 length:165 start_codon:yes stop_codon:yes gene_type:complete